MKIPIACSLDGDGARSQLREWRQVLAAAVASTAWVGPTELSLQLRDDLAQLEAIVRLAQREKACCPFFDFVIRIDTDNISLRITVPEGAEPLLRDFAGHD